MINYVPGTDQNENKAQWTPCHVILQSSSLSASLKAYNNEIYLDKPCVARK